jgi:two-component system chemotaxis response regulator CheB
MAHRSIVVVGASAGGVEALSRMAASLPEDLRAALLVVLHLSSDGTSLLPSILSRQGPLPATHARSGERVQYGRIYVAPPNRHLMLHDGLVRLSLGARENGHRPAVDTLFRSAARAAGPAAIGVILSGALDDGTAGLAAIRTWGGVAVAQEPEDALYPAMPKSVIEQVGVDHVVPAAEMGELLSALSKEPLEGDPPPVPDGMLVEEDEIFRFRWRVGHEWSPEGLLAQHNDGIEGALWIALRSLEERGALSRRLARSAEQRNHQITASRFHQQAAEAEHGAAQVRAVLADPSKLTGGSTLLGTSRPPGDAHEGVADG